MKVGHKINHHGNEYGQRAVHDHKRMRHLHVFDELFEDTCWDATSDLHPGFKQDLRDSRDAPDVHQDYVNGHSSFGERILVPEY